MAPRRQAPAAAAETRTDLRTLHLGQAALLAPRESRHLWTVAIIDTAERQAIAAKSRSELSGLANEVMAREQRSTRMAGGHCRTTAPRPARRKNAGILRRARRAGTFVSLLLSILVGGFAGWSSAGATTPHYDFLARQILSNASSVSCADIEWAAKTGTITPVEVHWLMDLRPQQCGAEYRQELVLYALTGEHVLTCADIRWNAAYGLIPNEKIVSLLSYVPGCELNDYEWLATLSAGSAIPHPVAFGAHEQGIGVLACSDINWHAQQGLITAEQAGWLRAVLLARNVACGPPTPPPSGGPVQPPPGQVVVDYRVTPGQSCYPEGIYAWAAIDQAGNSIRETFAWTTEGRLARCISTLGPPLANRPSLGSNVTRTWDAV